jgi:hypothetical protein
VCPSRRQAQNVLGYIRGLLHLVPALAKLITNETSEVVSLSNGISIEVFSASINRVRGFTMLACLADETAFWPTDESANPDIEILRSIQPSLMTTGGMLMIASSPYAKRGVLWDWYQRYWGQDDAKVLVWHAGSLTMHPSLDAAEIERQRVEDPEFVQGEYDAQFRDDVAAFLDPELISGLVDRGITARAPRPDVQYFMALDQSGGRGDAAAAAVGHLEEGRTIVDALYHRQAPFVPSEMLAEVAALARRYRVTRARIDKYSEPLITDGLKRVGLLSEVSEISQSDVYLRSVQFFAEGSVRLLDDRQLVYQITQLQRRSSPTSAKDTVTHPHGAHDDVAAALAQLVVMLGTDGRPSVIDHRKLADDAASAPEDITGIMAVLWTGLNGYGWVVSGLYDKHLQNPKNDKMVVLSAGEGVWSWAVLQDVARAMRRASDIASPTGFTKGGAEIGAVLMCPVQLQGHATQAIWDAFMDRGAPPEDAVGFMAQFGGVVRQEQLRSLGAVAIEDHWLDDPGRLALGVETLVGTGRITRGPDVDKGIFRYLSIKAGERLEDEPLRVAQLICYGCLLPDREMRQTRSASRMAWG